MADKITFNRRQTRSDPYESTLRDIDSFANRYLSSEPIKLESEHGYVEFGQGRTAKIGLKKQF